MRKKVNGKAVVLVDFGRNTGLSDQAFSIYNNSSFCIYQDYDNVYYVADNNRELPKEIGTIKDVNEWLLGYAE